MSLSLIPRHLVLCSMALAVSTAVAQTPREYADSNTVFNWAEQQFPQFFSSNTTTQSVSGYLARYYEQNDVWLGSGAGQVYVYGALFNDLAPVGTSVKVVGQLSDYVSLAHADSGLVINEVVAKAADDGHDWFELMVTGTQAVNLGEYTIVDNQADREPIALPNISLQPNEFVVIYATDAVLDNTSDYAVDFKLGSSDSLSLYHNGMLVDYIAWQDNDAPTGYSFGLSPDGSTGQGQTLQPTPAASNQVSDSLPVIPAIDSATASIVFNGDSISADNTAVTIDGNIATIGAAGTYTLSGTLTQGQVVVDTAVLGDVKLIFNGVNLSNSSSSAVLIKTANQVIISLAANSDNYLSDGTNYVFASAAEDEPDATLYSKADLTLEGSGKLTINANYKDGMKSKDGLVINGGQFVINAADDAIMGKDYVNISAGHFEVNAQGDGIKSTNEDDTNLGYVTITDGTFNITAGSDAIQAQTNVNITEGIFTLNTGGGSNNSVSGDASAKGIKATTSIVIEGGVFGIESADDTIHANDSIVIKNGSFNLSSGDDGIHADTSMTIEAGDFNISKSYEGIESAEITINGGTFHIVASDDGINVAGGADGSSMGQFAPNPNSNNALYINGGYIVVNADGDGLDANGNIVMTNGTVLVNGPTASNNGALDYDGSFNLSGGYVVAVGSSGMAATASTTSTQNAVLIGFDTAVSAGSLIHISNDAGDNIVTFAPSKTAQSLAFSSDQLLTGATYHIYTGGSSTGTPSDGLYQGGTYSDGNLYTSFTIESIVTSVNIQAMGGPGQRPQRPTGTAPAM